jgi:hypothetical protein
MTARNYTENNFSKEKKIYFGVENYFLFLNVKNTLQILF